MIIMTMIIYGSVGIFRRYIPYSSAVLSCFRGFAGALFLVVLSLIQKRKLRNNIGFKKVLGLVLSGIFMGFNWILLFEAYNYTTVATATLCYYMEPTVVILLSPLFFKEKITAKKGICALIAVIGMVFVSGVVEHGMPTFGEAKGIIFGLGAAILYASVVITNKMIPGVDAYEKTIIQLLSAAVILVPYIFLTEKVSFAGSTTTVIVLMLILGFIHTGLAYSIYFGNLDKLKSQTVALLSYIDPITALILSAIILHESMTVFGIIGAVLIIGAAAVSEIELKKRT